VAFICSTGSHPPFRLLYHIVKSGAGLLPRMQPTRVMNHVTIMKPRSSLSVAAKAVELGLDDAVAVAGGHVTWDDDVCEDMITL
jgi:hypothetical protein